MLKNCRFSAPMPKVFVMKLSSLLLVSETYKIGETIPQLLCIAVKHKSVLSIREAKAYKESGLNIQKLNNVEVNSLIRCAYNAPNENSISVISPFNPGTRNINIAYKVRYFLCGSFFLIYPCFSIWWMIAI